MTVDLLLQPYLPLRNFSRILWRANKPHRAPSPPPPPPAGVYLLKPDVYIYLMI